MKTLSHQVVALYRIVFGSSFAPDSSQLENEKAGDTQINKYINFVQELSQTNHECLSIIVLLLNLHTQHSHLFVLSRYST